MGLNHFANLRNLIGEADRDGLLSRPDGLSGYSGEGLIGALQRIARYQQELGAGAYLEVGVFQGLTLLSVASAVQPGKAYGIDNFAQFDPKHRNRTLIEEKRSTNNLTNAHLIEDDYERALETLDRYIEEPVGLYFVDGPHDYRSQLVCLLFIREHLSDRAVIVIDDCNYPWVRLATRDFLLADPTFKLIFETYTSKHPSNMEPGEWGEAAKGWWNGVNILAADPHNSLTPMYPPVAADRRLHENEHLIHGAPWPEIAPEATFFFSHLLQGRLLKAGSTLRNLLSKRRELGPRKGQYPSMNTDSTDLRSSRMNPSLQADMSAGDTGRSAGETDAQVTPRTDPSG